MYQNGRVVFPSVGPEINLCWRTTLWKTIHLGKQQNLLFAQRYCFPDLLFPHKLQWVQKLIYAEKTFEFDFAKDITEDLVLITCCIYEQTLELDNFRNFKLI